MSANKLIDRIIHRWLRVPYKLHVRVDKKIGRPKQTVVFIHGIGGNGDVWKDVLAKLAIQNVRVVVVDLIGFGKSPRPTWAKYSTVFQAKSLSSTLLRIGVFGRVSVVGHSMGSLVAIEFARRYPLRVKRLVLCSPPLYKAETTLMSPDRRLRKIFSQIKQAPDRFVLISKLAKKYRVVNREFNVTAANFNDFVNALESAVINQTALQDAKKLTMPIDIVHGLSDPVVPALNLFALAKANKNVHVQTILAGHEVMGTYVRPLVKILNKQLG